MEIKEVKVLLDKHEAGTATPEERALLESWYLNYEEAGTAESLSMEERVKAVDKVWANLEDKHGLRKKISLWPRIAVAASVLVALTIGLYFIGYKGKQGLEGERLANTPADIAPGGNKAVLTYGNGKTIDLSANKAGVVINTSRLTYSDGTVVDQSAVAASEELSLNTPKGGTYQVVLPDGTKVWLNASSSLVFPSSFTGAATRDVLLKGEAYFEVARNKKQPFRVNTQGQLVEVLGTHFNISSYQDEPEQKTTLLEGSIRIGNLLLKPGEQAVLTASRTTITKADIEETMGWKNGYFIFEDEGIQSIMRKIARWYNVDVVYEGEVPDATFGGRVSRAGYVSEILKTLELTDKVHFKVEGRRITVIK